MSTAAFFGVIFKPAAVADLCIEHLAGGEGMTKVCCSHTTADAVTHAANFVETKGSSPSMSLRIS